MFENVYLLCIRDKIDTYDIFFNKNVRLADTTARQFSKMIKSQPGPEVLYSCQKEIIMISWLLSVCDALGVSLTKLMAKMSSKNKNELIHTFMSEHTGIWETHGHEDDNPEKGATIEFEEGGICYSMIYNKAEGTVDLVANIIAHGFRYHNGKQARLSPYYRFPPVVLYSKQDKSLKAFFMRELYSVRKREETLFKKHKFIQDTLVKPNDKIFRFFSPYTKCMSESGKHSFEDVIGVVNILSFTEHKTVVENFNGFYCPECFRYFIPEEEYRRLKKIGIICCKILGSSQSEQEENPFSGFSAESILHQYGYNVNAINNLSEENRRDILAFILENKILSRGEIVSHIELLVNLAKSRMNMANAISKWKSDIAYINSYERTGQFVVDCDAIRVPNHEKDMTDQSSWVFEYPHEE